MKTSISEYLKDPDGNYSSTRLMCWRTLNFFFVWTIFSALLLVGFALLFRTGGEMATVLAMLGGYFTVISVLSLIGAYAPKQLAKIQEIKKLIETIRTNGKS